MAPVHPIAPPLLPRSHGASRGPRHGPPRSQSRPWRDAMRRNATNGLVVGRVDKGLDSDRMTLFINDKMVSSTTGAQVFHDHQICSYQMIFLGKI